MKKLLLLFNLMTFSLVTAQIPRGIDCNYSLLLREGKNYAEKGEYTEALRKFNSARRCDPNKGDEIDKEIDQVFKLIKKQRDEARLAKVIAEKERQKAEQNSENLKRKLEQIDQAIQLALKHADQLVLELKYDAAWARLEGLIYFNIRQTDLAKALIELAFWNMEVGNFERSIDMLKTISGPNLLKNEQVSEMLLHIPELQASKLKYLRESVKKLNLEIYEQVQRKYYPTMIKIPGGKFIMGEADTTIANEVTILLKNENAVTKSINLSRVKDTIAQVEVQDYEISQTETTIWQWSIFCKNKGRSIDQYFPQNADSLGRQPAVNISWYEALEYADWLNSRYGLAEEMPIKSSFILKNNVIVEENLKEQGFRLPLQAEWEYAARERGKDIVFGNGKNIADPTEINFNGQTEYKKNFSVEGENRGRTIPVASFPPNSLRLYDLSGNVKEWCFDFEKLSERENMPRGPRRWENNYCCYSRGGAWNDRPVFLRVTRRGYCIDPSTKSGNLGFRLARTVANN